MNPTTGWLLSSLFALAAPLATAADTVSGSISSEGTSPPLADTALKHGIAYVNRDVAAQGSLELVLILADQILSDKIAQTAENPGAAFQHWLMQNQRSKSPLTWAMLNIDEQATPYSLNFGRGLSAQGLSADNVALSLTQADGNRVTGQFEVIDPEGGGKGKVQFDLAFVGTEGIDAVVLERLTHHPERAAAAEQAARSTYATFVQALREDRVSDAVDLRRDEVDLGPTGPGSAEQSPWPEQVYASRIKFDPIETGGLNWDYVTARLAACRKREDGSAQRVLITLWKYGADQAWTIAAQSEEDYDVAPLGPTPASCGTPKS